MILNVSTPFAFDIEQKRNLGIETQYFFPSAFHQTNISSRADLWRRIEQRASVLNESPDETDSKLKGERRTAWKLESGENM